MKLLGIKDAAEKHEVHEGLRDLLSKLLGIKEAAEYLNISQRSVERMVSNDEIPRVRLPGVRRVLFHRDDLDKLIRSSRDVPAVPLYVPTKGRIVSVLGGNRRGGRR